MIQQVQPRAKALGESGCYFLSLCKIAEDYNCLAIYPLENFYACILGKIVAEDATVLDAGAVFSALVQNREHFEVVKAGPGHPLPLDYLPKPGEREILRFERPNPAGGDPLAHFVVGDGKGCVAWDPWPGSLTAAQGRLVSKRIVRRIS